MGKEDPWLLWEPRAESSAYNIEYITRVTYNPRCPPPSTSYNQTLSPPCTQKPSALSVSTYSYITDVLCFDFMATTSQPIALPNYADSQMSSGSYSGNNGSLTSSSYRQIIGSPLSWRAGSFGSRFYAGCSPSQLLGPLE